jgi:nucleotide-binding universal stress UspA family protein
MKILIAADGSPYTEKATRFVIDHRRTLAGDGELHLLHVKLPLPKGLAVENARALLGDSAVNNYYKEEAEVALAVAEKPLRDAGISFQSGYSVGDIAEELQKYADKHGIELLVMGSHGHGALANVVLGSVATKVLAKSKVPVLVVR